MLHRQQKRHRAALQGGHAKDARLEARANYHWSIVMGASRSRIETYWERKRREAGR